MSKNKGKKKSSFSRNQTARLLNIDSKVVFAAIRRHDLKVNADNHTLAEEIDRVLAEKPQWLIDAQTQFEIKRIKKIEAQKRSEIKQQEAKEQRLAVIKAYSPDKQLNTHSIMEFFYKRRDLTETMKMLALYETGKRERISAGYFLMLLKLDGTDPEALKILLGERMKAGGPPKIAITPTLIPGSLDNMSSEQLRKLKYSITNNLAKISGWKSKTFNIYCKKMHGLNFGVEQMTDDALRNSIEELASWLDEFRQEDPLYHDDMALRLWKDYFNDL